MDGAVAVDVDEPLRQSEDHTPIADGNGLDADESRAGQMLIIRLRSEEYDHAPQSGAKRGGRRRVDGSYTGAAAENPAVVWRVVQIVEVYDATPPIRRG